MCLLWFVLITTISVVFIMSTVKVRCVFVILSFSFLNGVDTLFGFLFASDLLLF